MPDSLSVEVLYRRHAQDVIRWARRLVGPGTDVGDVAHEVFLVVQRRLPEFRGDARVTTWLHQITVHVAQRQRRQTRRWCWFRSRDGRSGDRASSLAGFLLSLPRPAAPDMEASKRESVRTVRALLAKLDDKHRTAITLFELEGLSIDEIARVTGTTTGNVRIRLCRARSQLAQQYLEWKP